MGLLSSDCLAIRGNSKTPEMKNGLVWNTNNEGLLYLISKNPNYFKLIYNENGIEIWGV